MATRTTKTKSTVSEEVQSMPIETLVPYIEKFESQRKELVTQIQMYESKLSELKELYLKLSGAVEALNLIEADLNKEDEPEESENF